MCVGRTHTEDQQELMMVKRDLRDVQPYGTIWFVSPFLRGTTKEAPDHFRRLIGYGEFGQGTFSLHHCQLVILPECQAQNAWDLELQTLGEIKDWLLRCSEVIPSDLVARTDLLRASASMGLEENLFWVGPGGQKLALRHDFTLAPTQKSVSQADIFCVISSFLHQLRGATAGKRRLIYTPFARSVIAPSVFTKYNDGVLQAAILRAARGHELHYANSPDKASGDMLSILTTEVDEIGTGRGEALMEFVLAIIAGKLTLDQKHVVDFGQSLQKAKIPDSLRAASLFMLHIFSE